MKEEQINGPGDYDSEGNTKDEFYPGNQYQKLFNWLRDKNFIALNSEMKEVIKIVHEDFPEGERQIGFTFPELKNAVMLTNDEERKILINILSSKINRVEEGDEKDAIAFGNWLAADFDLHDGLFYHKEDEDGDHPLLPAEAYKLFNAAPFPEIIPLSAPVEKDDKFEFAEWMLSDDNPYQKRYSSDDDNDGKWFDYYSEGINRHYFTTKDLYKVFKNRKQ